MWLWCWRCTIFLCLLRSDVSHHDLSDQRIGEFGGSPMPETTIKKLRQQLHDLELIHAYGATEKTSPVTILPVGDDDRHPNSIGTVVPCGDIWVTDEYGREVGVGQPSELWIGGPMVVPGYWHNPEADQREFVAANGARVILARWIHRAMCVSLIIIRKPD